MSNYTWEYIEEHKKETKRLLGIDYEQLEQLVEYVLVVREKQQKEMENNQTRLIKAGGGRKSKLSQKTQIILTLVYLRHHVSFQLLGFTFKVSESTAHNIFHHWRKIIRSALPCSLIEQGERGEDLEEILKELAEKILLIDSEEQQIERDSSYQEQKKYYSGKKKQHTFKNQIISINNATSSGKIVDIVDVVAGEPGPKSDIKICRENLDKLPEGQKLIGDRRLCW